jgi:hypothetical protein
MQGNDINYRKINPLKEAMKTKSKKTRIELNIYTQGKRKPVIAHPKLVYSCPPLS